MGTDLHEATDFIDRTADSGDLGKGRVSAEVGLELVTNGIVNGFFDRMKHSKLSGEETATLMIIEHLKSLKAPEVMAPR